jgi:hypothetical protein
MKVHHRMILKEEQKTEVMKLRTDVLTFDFVLEAEVDVTHRRNTTAADGLII